MRLKNIEQVNDFLAAVEKAKGNVRLTSIYGDVFELKSQLTRFVAIAALLGEHGEDLELFCDNRDDEVLFYKFFREHPEVN